jgi:drug/metabolite transporter (DMT)-like permease
VLSFKSLGGLVAVVGFTIAANVMLKLGAAAPASDRIVLGMFGWKTIFGLALFGCGGLVYAAVLRWVPHVAQSFTAAQFIGVIGAASIVLSEPISPIRWVGIGCICLGILLVGLTAV